MSYAEYLRRKAASTPTVVDTRVNTDASMYIMKTRMATNRVFFTGARVGVINNVNNPSVTPASNDAVRSYTKTSGGSIPDASAFTAFVGGTAINEEGIKANSVNGKITLPANLPAALCTNAYRNGPVAPKSAGDWTRGQTPCVNGREPHIQNELGPSRFVDDTITLKHLTSCCDGSTQTPINNAIHTHPAPTPRQYWSARPRKSAQPILVVSSPSNARKVGRALRKIPYVEKHHGNDLFVDQPALFKRYQIPRNAPAQLKVNDPQHSIVA